MSLCYACRNTIDPLSTRCLYCTSEVEMYSGNRPTVYQRSAEPANFGPPANEIPTVIMVGLLFAGIAWLAHSWWLFGILEVFLILMWAI